MMKRRQFLKHSTLASTSLFVPGFLQGFSDRISSGSRQGKVLVVVQLSGGNDGLNTVVPFRNEIYYRERPILAISDRDVLRVSDTLGFNPSLASLRELYDQGLVSIVNSVGYPNPDRSHFRSMDIWHTASNSDEYWNTGWLGRYLDSDCQECRSPYHVLEVDDSLSLALKGERHKGFATSDPRQLKKTAENPFLRTVGQQYGAHDHTPTVNYLYKTMIDTQSSADYLYRQSMVHQARATFPPTPFGRDLKLIAELITADTDTQVYYVSLTGFDTHANQKNRQERLLQEYADGMKALVQELQQNGLLQDTLILTFSEFGRRVRQNGSNGTDHGTANNVFLIGGGLKKPGFYNEGPDLVNLDADDLHYQVDFRSIYAAILERWLDVGADSILKGNFSSIGVV